MNPHIDQEVLAGFLEEARGYLPEILEGLGTVQAEPHRLDALEVVHRHLHSIKGAAAMVGLPTLSHVAFYTEEAVEQIATGLRAWDADAEQVMQQGIGHLLTLLENGELTPAMEEELLRDLVAGFRRWRGEPESGDAAELAGVLARQPHSFLSAPEPVMFAPPEWDDLPTPEFSAIAETPQTESLEDVPAELLEAFQQEAEEHLQVVASRLSELDQNPAGRNALLLEVRRSVHTLKGASGMVGLKTLSRLSHRMEDLLDHMAEGAVGFNEEIRSLLLATSDALHDLLGQGVAPGELKRLYAAYDAMLAGVAPVGAPAAALEPLHAEQPIDVPEQAGSADAEQPLEGGARRQGGQFVRVPIERLDELVRLVSELVVNRSTFEQQLSGYRQEVHELDMSVERVRRISGRLDTDFAVTALQGSWLFAGGPATPRNGRNSEFDALEFDRYTEFHLLSRDLTEVASDLATAENRLEDIGGDFDGYRTRLERLTSEIQDKLMRLRMVPLGTLSTRLQRTVRRTAELRNKQVDLLIEGEQIELDKTVLEEMVGPLEHILRNSVDHGIEGSGVRRQAGKSERGTIRLRAFYEGTQVVLQIKDDGGGFQPAKLRDAIVRQGYATHEEVAVMSETELASYVFQPGFSTASEVTEVSGRGIGLDVLKTSVTKLKGTISIDSQVGQGVTFTIRLPLTLAVARVLMVRAAGGTYAVPLRAVTQILRVEPEQIERIGNKEVLRVEGRIIPVIHLADALGLPHAVTEPNAALRRRPVLILSLGDQKLGLMADQLTEAREVVVKSLGNVLRRVKGVSGATLTGDGTVVLIVNPSEFLEQSTLSAARRRRSVQEPGAPAAASRPLELLIVDDSLSVRRVLTGTLKNVGWNVTAAKDGLEALELLGRSPQKPDCILLDVEMPRMDGYELTATLRGQDATRHIPIVMLTSRSGEKHRQKAFQLGATDYLVKPYHDDTLLSVVRRVVHEMREAEAARTAGIGA